MVSEFLAHTFYSVTYLIIMATRNPTWYPFSSLLTPYILLVLSLSPPYRPQHPNFQFSILTIGIQGSFVYYMRLTLSYKGNLHISSLSVFLYLHCSCDMLWTYHLLWTTYVLRFKSIIFRKEFSFEVHLWLAFFENAYGFL